MRWALLVATLLAFGLLIYLQLGNIQQVLYMTRAAENPNNVNKQLEDLKMKNDQYNRSIENLQTQTEDTMKSVNK